MAVMRDMKVIITDTPSTNPIYKEKSG